MLGELVCGGANVTNNRSQWNPMFMYLGGLEPAGLSRRRISSFSEAFLSSNVVFCSIASVGSLASFLYAASSRREEIFCL